MRKTYLLSALIVASAILVSCAENTAESTESVISKYPLTTCSEVVEFKTNDGHVCVAFGMTCSNSGGLALSCNWNDSPASRTSWKIETLEAPYILDAGKLITER